MEWNYLLFKGLYGKYGHSLDLCNCSFTDLVIALSMVVGPDNFFVDTEGQKQLVREKEEEEKKPIPSGATS